MTNIEPFFSEAVIPDHCHGMRLDRVVTKMWPGLGRRGARRVFEVCRVEVDGRSRAKSFRVSEGELVRIQAQEICPADIGIHARHLEPEALRVQVAERNADFAALVKPAGMHCERLPEKSGSGPAGRLPCRGGDGARLTMEEVLPGLLPGISAILLNRLDRTVSGLVLAALHLRAARDYAAWQDQGRVRKKYLAVVHGRLSFPVVVRSALDTAKRRRVRALSVDEPDSLRWTRVTPLVASRTQCLDVMAALGRGTAHVTAWNDDLKGVGEVSAALVEILKGRRHQIRAHLASIGHPVLLDPLYGEGPEAGWIGLHHFGIHLPGFQADSGKDFELLLG